MVYVTLPTSPIFRQVSLEELLDGYVDLSRFEPVRNAPSSTRTTCRESLPYEFVSKYDIAGMIRALNDFNDRHKNLFDKPRKSLYRHFEIDKSTIDPKTGQFKKRPIDAPCPELKAALNELKMILEEKCGALYHTNAFAYVKKRCAVDSIRRHQANESHWFLKTDFSNFFGNTTEEFLNRMLSMVFPFSEIYKTAGKESIERALSLCFLNGGLPQGSPISPMLTNLMMIPIDHKLANSLRDFNKTHYIYTRYADDILISSKVNFHFMSVVGYINTVLKEFDAPFSINPEKTRYGSGNGHNFNLGVILNERNEITIGYKKKQAFRSMLSDFVRTYKMDGMTWDISEIQTMQGLLSYYSSVEPNYWDRTIKQFNKRYSIDLKQMIADAI